MVKTTRLFLFSVLIAILPGLRASTVTFFEVKLLGFSLLLDWLCPQGSNSGCNIIGVKRD